MTAVGAVAAKEPLQYLYMRDETPLIQDGLDSSTIQHLQSSQSYSRRNQNIVGSSESKRTSTNYSIKKSPYLRSRRAGQMLRSGQEEQKVGVRND